MGTAIFCSVGHGDCTIIQGSTNTYLIDCHEIHRYRKYLPSNKHLRGVFITHQHYDHYSGLQYLLDNQYKIDFLIYSPYVRRHGDLSSPLDEWNEFESLRDDFVRRGSQTRAPYRQSLFDKPWWRSGEEKFWILGPFKTLATSPTRELHDACLAILVAANERKFLVVGDSSDGSLRLLAANTKNYCNDLLRASHHGSINGADLDFVRKANAKYIVVSTEAGVYRNVPHATAMQRYSAHASERVFRTDHDGTITAGY